jgi:hypothetical protein
MRGKRYRAVAAGCTAMALGERAQEADAIYLAVFLERGTRLTVEQLRTGEVVDVYLDDWLRRAAAKGWVEQVDGCWCLTDAGVEHWDSVCRTKRADEIAIGLQSRPRSLLGSWLRRR